MRRIRTLLVIVGIACLAAAAPAGAKALKPDTPPSKPGVPKPAYITSKALEAAFRENGAVQHGRKRTVLKIACKGFGSPLGPPPSRYHIFDCRITTPLLTGTEYRVTTFHRNGGIYYQGDIVP